MKKMILVLQAFLLTSCANYFVRQECEKMNWYQVGFDAALRGERISNDAFVNKCRKAEAEISESKLDQGFKAGMSRYCQPEGVYATGKSGETFNTDFCEPGQLSLLRKRHSDGINAYCSDGNQAGLSGKKYKNVCPQNLEKAFLPDYRKGRKKYLDGMIRNQEAKVRDLNVEVDRLAYEKRIVDSRLSVLPMAAVGDKDPYRQERDSLNNRSWSINSDLNTKKSQKSKLEEEIDTLKQEVVTLD